MRKLHTDHMMIIVVSFLIIYSFSSLHAEDKQEMSGWGSNDPYNKFYNAGEVERLKVVVIELQEVVPLPGMSPGVALLVKESEEESFLVHLCPSWYKSQGRIGIKKGDKISVRGCFAEINGEDVFMAAKIKKRGNSFKVRLTSDGTPFWTMSPGQLQKELSDQ